MTQQTFSRGMIIPSWPTQTVGAPGFAVLATDAADEVATFIVKSPKTGNIRGVWFSAAVAGPALREIGIYQIDVTTGTPSTPPTIWSAGASVQKTLQTTDSQDFVYSGNFGTDAYVDRGSVFGICFIAPASVTGTANINYFGDNTGTVFPYGALYTTSWAKSAGTGNVLLQYADSTFEIPFGCVAMGDAAGNTVVTTSFSNTSNPNVRGARFQFPGPVRANGAWVWVDADANFDVKLVSSSWDGASSGVLATCSFDAEIRSGTGPLIQMAEFDGGPVDLSANTNYRLVFQPTSGSTSVISAYHYPCVDANQLGAQPLGANFHLTTVNNDGSITDGDWTNYDNSTDGFRVPFMGLVIDGISDGTGGSGGTTNVYNVIGE